MIQQAFTWTFLAALLILEPVYFLNNEVPYLENIIEELRKEWPGNKTINIVFHGHSVPAGYFVTPEIHTLEAYPHLILKKINQQYPTSQVNVIVTAIGGENSLHGEKRFEKDVISHGPDLIFIDYSLNDRIIGLEKARVAWAGMIEAALSQGIKVVLLTSTPDLKEDIYSDKSELAKHSDQVRSLAMEYRVGIVDSYLLFKELAKNEDLEFFMAQNNHINEMGHTLVANEIYKLFNPELRP